MAELTNDEALAIRVKKLLKALYDTHSQKQIDEFFEEVDLGANRRKETFAKYPELRHGLNLDSLNRVLERKLGLRTPRKLIPGTDIIDRGIPEEDVETKTFMDNALDERAKRARGLGDGTPSKPMFPKPSDEGPMTQSSTKPSGGKKLFNKYDAAIPGSSLTQPTNKNPGPPQFTDIDEAMMFIIGSMSEPKRLKEMLGMMDEQSLSVSAEEIARVITFGGVVTNKWNPDLALLLGQPILALITTIAQRARIPYKIPMKDRTKPSDNTQRMALLREFENRETLKPDEQIDEAQTPVGGLMSPRSA